MSDDDLVSINEMTREELIDSFARPCTWAYHGIGMLRSAYKIWQINFEYMKRGYQGAENHEEITQSFMTDLSTNRFANTYKFLIATAIENLAKGLVIAKDKLSIKNHKLPKELTHHDIITLFDKACFSLNNKERKELKDLKKTITWQGRYPTPKNINSLPKKGGFMEFAIAFQPPTYFRDLAIRILRDYPNESFPPQFSPQIPDLIHIMEVECPNPERLS